MTGNAPFSIIPWENDFLTGLARLVLHETQGNPGRACIIMPHSRPGRYLARTLHALPELPKPFAMPAMYTVTDLFRAMRTETEPNPPEQIETLDRVGLLAECVRMLRHESDNAPALPVEDTNRFFPWGVRLASLLEDLYNQNLQPQDVLYMEGQVVPFAATLLGALGRTHQAYTRMLDDNGWTTPGYDAFRVVRSLQAVPEHDYACLRDRTIFIAGFYGLNGVEEALFRHLHMYHGAHIVLHTDARIATGEGSPHWAAREHARWMQRWNMGSGHTYLAEPPVQRTPVRTFHEGFDLHSQLDVLEQTLTGTESHQGTAVVLPDTGLLMPVLHHLPDKDVNISMGYPLERSTLFRLLETAMRLQETRPPRTDGSAGAYYWKELIGLVRHPYLKMLSIGDEQPLAVPLRNMEASIRTGQRYSDPRDLHPDLAPASAIPEAETRTLLTRCLTLTITRWEQLQTPADMADALADLCSLLLEHGGTLWDRFPLDAESMYRLMRRVIPMLRECTLARQQFPRDVLFTILRQTIRQERVPFEADPLTGLQVLGMLETRLLRFDTVFVVDATEDKLPGAPANDPLLPDSLRSLLGLPDARHREQVAAYNFHRLLKGADTITILYQAGVERGGLFEDKRARSRYVEELLWQEERTRKSLLTPGTPPLYAISYPMPALCRSDRAVMRSDAVAARIESYLRARPLSPSALDAYMTCPVRFFHERICGLTPVDEVNEGDDFAGIGELLHAVLEAYLTPYIGRKHTYEQTNIEQLQALFVEQLQQSPLRDTLPYDSYLMLEAAGKLRLAQFLQHQPETRIVSLEQACNAPVRLMDGSEAPYRIAGRIDRVDERPEGIVILDYKTGSVNRPAPDVWEDDGFWHTLADWNGQDDDTLHDVAEALHSVQLPAYLYMYANSGVAGRTTAPADAGWVELKRGGHETFLFGKETPPEVRADLLQQHIPLLISFLFNHMRTAPAFRPRRGRHCDWCTCANCCSV